MLKLNKDQSYAVQDISNRLGINEKTCISQAIKVLDDVSSDPCLSIHQLLNLIARRRSIKLHDSSHDLINIITQQDSNSDFIQSIQNALPDDADFTEASLDTLSKDNCRESPSIQAGDVIIYFDDSTGHITFDTHITVMMDKLGVLTDTNVRQSCMQKHIVICPLYELSAFPIILAKKPSLQQDITQASKTHKRRAAIHQQDCTLKLTDRISALIDASECVKVI